MRRQIALALGALLLLQAGCERKPAAPPTPPAAPTAAPPEALAVPVTPPEGRFDAISNTALGVTGDMTGAAGVLTFAQGQSYGLVGEGRLKGSDPYASTKASFASLISVADSADLEVFKVTKEDPAKARNGGFCGKGVATTYLVTHQGVDIGGAPALFVMAFKGASAPGAASAEADLCGTFMYGPKAG
ncbi:hypothetical protein [Phenylobacterium sp.]|uniref:hypothetical protein n=1 Tax=Phenylobacterium sp. TaxID=1871053 RepID=UPI00289995EE|nr:hypothetical protein [Phenylobacterium sp.]